MANKVKNKWIKHVTISHIKARNQIRNQVFVTRKVSSSYRTMLGGAYGKYLHN